MSDSKVKTQSSLILILFSLAALSSLAISLYQFYYVQDYPLYAVVECDPSEGNCFVDPCEDGDLECEGEEAFYYKYVSVMASDAPRCDPREGCPELACLPGDTACSVFYCSAQTIDRFAPWAACVN